jgi:hypothetical protein
MAASKRRIKGKGCASLDTVLLPFREDTSMLDEAERTICCSSRLAAEATLLQKPPTLVSPAF